MALQYAYRHLAAETYPGGICWLRAQADLGPQIVAFARTGLDLSPPDDLALDDKVQWCWRHWREGDVLVIFDDVWNYDSDTEQERKYPKVKPVLPPAERRFRVVLTTRLKLLASDQRLELDVLTEPAALELLRSLVTDGRIDQQLEVAKRVCAWLGYLPLALELVGRYLAQSPDTSLATLEQRLQAKRLEANALKETAPEMTASRNVVAAFELSWDTLDESGRGLAGLLSLFALAEIPWTLVQPCLPDWDEEDLEGVRNKQLLGRHLLQRPGEGMYQLHQLLREFFAAKREQMANDVALKQTVCRVMAAVATEMPIAPTLQQIEQFTPVIPHLKEVAMTLSGWLTDADLITPSILVLPNSTQGKQPMNLPCLGINIAWKPQKPDWVKTIPMSPPASIIWQDSMTPKGVTARLNRCIGDRLTSWNSSWGQSIPLSPPASTIWHSSTTPKDVTARPNRCMGDRLTSWNSSWGQSIPLSPPASTIWHSSTTPKGVTARLNRCMSDRWRSGNSSWGQSIPMSPPASTIWQHSTVPKGVTARLNRCMGEH